MPIDKRRIAVAFCAIGAFLHLYAPQAVLPSMAQDFGVGAADASLIITAGTLAVAATAPFTGALSDVLGRKRVIVVAMALLLIPATMTALAPTLQQIIFWRFIHGLLLPPIFAVTIAYVGDEWPPGEANAVFGVYASASAVGGFLGRFVPGMLTQYVGWRGGFLALAAGSVICVAMVALLLTPERRFVRATNLGTSLAADAGASAQPAAPRHLRGRLRRAVQFHRHVHLSELSSRRAAVQQIAGVPRLDLRGLSVRLGGVALARPRHRLARTAQLRAVRAGGMGRRHAVQPDPLGAGRSCSA